MILFSLQYNLSSIYFREDTNYFRREELFGAETSKSRPGRVWGAPIEETDETRQLDNSSLLQLQQNRMEGKLTLWRWYSNLCTEQDQVLDLLGNSVGTLKQISLDIGTETGL
jgi:hypothetical protein